MLPPENASSANRMSLIRVLLGGRKVVTSALDGKLAACCRADMAVMEAVTSVQYLFILYE